MLTGKLVTFAAVPYFHPVPDAEGLAKTKGYYLAKFGRSITDEEAYVVLGSLMRFLWLTRQEDGPSSEEALDAPEAD